MWEKKKTQISSPSLRCPEKAAEKKKKNFKAHFGTCEDQETLSIKTRK